MLISIRLPVDRPHFQVPCYSPVQWASGGIFSLVGTIAALTKCHSFHFPLTVIYPSWRIVERDGDGGQTLDGSVTDFQVLFHSLDCIHSFNDLIYGEKCIVDHFWGQPLFSD
jgi:hypothetical protein